MHGCITLEASKNEAVEKYSAYCFLSVDIQFKSQPENLSYWVRQYLCEVSGLL